MPSRLEPLIRTVPDFPKPGVQFKDITRLLGDPAGLALAVEFMANPFRNDGVELVVGAESRGFIFGTAVAQSLNAGFVPIRKPGKLPCETRSSTFELEYGDDSLELHVDSIREGQHVLLVDDLLATGGTMRACLNLVEGCGADVVGISVLIELQQFEGAARMAPIEVKAVLRY